MRLPFDEINDIAKESITEESFESLTQAEIEDEIEDLIIMAYTLGWGLFLEDTPDYDAVEKAINTEIAGKTYREYLAPHIEEKDIDGVYRVMETTIHQMYELGQYDGAKATNKTTKTWRTMEDEKVRDPHRWLNGVTVGIDEKFYVGEDGAETPGGFSAPELNVNCRCILTYQ